MFLLYEVNVMQLTCVDKRNAIVEIIDKTNEIGEAAGTKVILMFNEE